MISADSHESENIFVTVNKEIKMLDENIENKSQVNVFSSQESSSSDDFNSKFNENQITIQYWKAKNLDLWNKANSPEGEQDFRATCLLYEGQCSASNQSWSNEYQEYCNNYHHTTSLYVTMMNQKHNRTKLIIYDTESEKKEKRILNTPELLKDSACIALLPNGELFCYGNSNKSRLFGITLIIDRNYGHRILPSGMPYRFLSCAYFNGNVYCFGEKYGDFNTISSKLDLIENRWINLTPMPDDYRNCYTVMFNENILISEHVKKNILKYSIDIDSYSTIPYKIADNTRKVLIKADKLYLIECSYPRNIFESEDEYNWKLISNSIIKQFTPDIKVYSSYNKEGIYIATLDSRCLNYYKFNLNLRKMVMLKNENI